MNYHKENLIRIITGSLFVIVVFSAGFFLGLNRQWNTEKLSAFLGKDTAIDTDADFGPFWKVWNAINDKFPDADKVSSKDRIYGAIKGLVASLDDPYSIFFEPEETKSFEEEISGNFTGVGMELGAKNGYLTVIAPLADTPAEKAGIRSGDVVLKIDDLIAADMTLDEAIKHIRGEKGTTVTLTIVHKGEESPVEIQIVRDVINIPTIDTELRADGVFVVKLYNFSANSANLFKTAMRKFANSKANKLVIDLRGNPGGYLSAAVDMASWFLPGGKTVAIEDYGGGQEQKIYRSAGYNPFGDKIHIAVIVNDGSASASEILAGALRDHKRALLVGTESYGKGSVQEVVKITSDTILKVTVAKWLTPNGNSISEKGLTPDYQVEMTKEDVEKGNDPQMEKAAEILKNWPGIK